MRAGRGRMTDADALTSKAAQKARGEPPRARRFHVRYFAGRSADPAREWPLFRNSILPLCDGFALALAALLAMPLWQGVGYALVVLGALSVNGAYRPRICLRISDEIPRLTAFAAAPLVLLLPWRFPDVTLLALGAASLGLLCALRGGLYAALRMAHRHGRLTESALIVGTGHTGLEVGKILHDHPELGLRPLGYVGGPPRRPGCSLPVLGDLSDMAAVAVYHDARWVIACFADTRDGDADLVTALRANRDLPARVCVVPRMYEMATAIPARCRDELWGIPVIPLRPCGPRPAARLAKRAFDLIVGSLLLVITAPVQLALAVVMLLSCGRPVFFHQVRVTRGGDRMKITKFRTVAVENTNAHWSVSDDQCTRLGRWLRATHLDELPQLLNVIRGQMSLVGPRPEQPVYTSRFAKLIPRYEDRHRIHSGMTGWAQVNGLSGDTSIPERVRFDNYYIEHWSLWLDLIILARTLTQPLAGAADSVLHREDGKEADTVQPAAETTNSRIPHDRR
jgi:exopolysaccharide biosynthesis polyprenyl glycosylphosphotransferase